MSSRHRFVVAQDQVGNRLDRFLADSSPTWTRSRIRRWIDAGEVWRNGQQARPADRVQNGDEIVVNEPDTVAPDIAAEDIPLVIYLEDEHLLVLDKPAGLVIHPAAGNPDGTLVNALLHYCSDLSGIGGVERPGIVHRLDKDTTGLMVVAKTDRAHLALSLAFSRRQIGKTYLAVCYDPPTTDHWVIDEPIDRHPVDRKRMAVREGGRAARSIFNIRERLSGTALVACTLVSGRTHQIRVHLSHAGHAIVGDPIYSGRQWRNLIDPGQRLVCRDFPRQALHAWRLAFKHPVTEADVAVEAPLPADMFQLVEALRP